MSWSHVTDVHQAGQLGQAQCQEEVAPDQLVPEGDALLCVVAAVQQSAPGQVSVDQALQDLGCAVRVVCGVGAGEAGEFQEGYGRDGCG